MKIILSSREEQEEWEVSRSEKSLFVYSLQSKYSLSAEKHFKSHPKAFELKSGSLTQELSYGIIIEAVNYLRSVCIDGDKFIESNMLLSNRSQTAQQLSI